jgi:hypothetical protein
MYRELYIENVLDAFCVFGRKESSLINPFVISEE